MTCNVFGGTLNLAQLNLFVGNYQADLRQRFSISSHMYGDYKTDISFVVAQETLLW